MNAARTLRWARRRAGLSQRDLARKAGVPQSTVGRIEAGLVDPRLSTFSDLLRACGIVLEPEDDMTDGVDRSLIRLQLERTPTERVAHAAEWADLVATLREGLQRARAR